MIEGSFECQIQSHIWSWELLAGIQGLNFTRALSGLSSLAFALPLLFWFVSTYVVSD